MLRWRTYLLCTLAVLAVPALARSQADGPQYWAVTGVRSDDTLNLRAAPNADSRRVAQIPHDARGLKNLGCPNHVTFEQWKRMTQAQKDRAARARWCQVEYNGMKGWVAGRFLMEDGAK